MGLMIRRQSFQEKRVSFIFLLIFKWDGNHGPSNARLHRPKIGWKRGAWSSRTNDISQWIQVDLRGKFKVAKIGTQGRQDYAQWVTQYKVSYSTDGVHFNFQDKVGALIILFFVRVHKNLSFRSQPK